MPQPFRKPLPDYEFAYIDIGAVNTGELIQQPQMLRFATAPSRARRVVRSGDTIVATVRTYLKAVYFVGEEPGNLICSPGFAVLTPRTGTISKYVSYVAQSNAFTDRVTAHSFGIAYPAIAESRLASFHVAVPPSGEQAAIVRFLDHADRRIGRYNSREAETDQTTGGAEEGHHSSRRHPRSRSPCPAQALRRGVAGRRAGALGGEALSLSLP